MQELEEKSIELFNLPIGRQSFIATVDKICTESEINYHGYDVDVPYVYLKNIKVLIGVEWFNVKNDYQKIKSKIGKRLEKHNLEEEDIITFDAQVEESEKEFFYFDNRNIQGGKKGRIEEDSTDILPNKYNGDIKLEIYSTTFNQFKRLDKENYTDWISKKDLSKAIKEYNYKIEPTKKKVGCFCKISSAFFENRVIKNLSNIDKC